MSDSMILFPLMSGVLPRPGGGRAKGIFLPDQGGNWLARLAGTRTNLLLCPWLNDEERLYPVGVSARVLDVEAQPAFDEDGQAVTVFLATLEGQEFMRWHSFRGSQDLVLAEGVEAVPLRQMRKKYPAISGAGWQPAGGYTEFRGPEDLPVTIYGLDVETGREVSITANLGGLVTPEQAHTIEHGIIRALQQAGLCTTRTLLSAISHETEELKWSVEAGIRFAMPEILGQTQGGACGNPMTYLAQAYFSETFLEQLESGENAADAVERARKSAMSQVMEDLDLTGDPQLRALEGLKKGMSHDDTPLPVAVCKRVLQRFPFSPWG